MNARSKKKDKRSAAPRRESAGKREANKERTRQQILKAALDLFSTKGFFQTATREISRKAGIAEGTLFNYFETKEDLALYFFEQEIANLITWFSGQKRLEKADLPEKLFAIVHRHLERISPYEDFIGAVYLRALRAVSKLSPLSLESQELNVRYLRFIRNILAEAESKEEIPRVGDAGAYVFAIFHLAMISYWLHDTSSHKEQTLALLDRSLQMARSILRSHGGWEW
jgi:AcrR family transcriptional regulator